MAEAANKPETSDIRLGTQIGLSISSFRHRVFDRANKQIILRPVIDMGPGYRFNEDAIYNAIIAADGTRLTRDRFVKIIKDVYKELKVKDYGSLPTTDAADAPRTQK